MPATRIPVRWTSLLLLASIALTTVGVVEASRAVRSQRVRRKILAFSGWPGGGPDWTADELALLGTGTDRAVAEKIGRTWTAVAQKRAALKVPRFRTRRLRAI